ncbi:hypothetical protein KIN20_006258 [Parelaphostrongylus tenuis]|uniref:Uncharacterized protein n=1 Tax=Parelaphostrongylus tenuis TaxID=148309 RepID=A0AAD5MMR2_PARTN|nr:hypothetical protein KIN20_006258 [Parelaphostrongylus tenuis]
MDTVKRSCRPRRRVKQREALVSAWPGETDSCSVRSDLHASQYCQRTHEQVRCIYTKFTKKYEVMKGKKRSLCTRVREISVPDSGRMCGKTDTGSPSMSPGTAREGGAYPTIQMRRRVQDTPSMERKDDRRVGGRLDYSQSLGPSRSTPH